MRDAVGECGRIAVVCIAKDEDYYLYEWLDYHFRLGFDDAYVYMNDWRYAGRLPDVPGHSAILVDWPGKAQQLPAYRDFMARFSPKYDWAAFIDVDEYLANNTGCSLQALLARHAHVPQLSVNWRIMGDSGLVSFDPAFSSVALRFTMGGRRLNQHVKQLVNLALFRAESRSIPVFGSPHCTTAVSYCFDGTPVYGPFNTHGCGDVQPLELYHYRVKTEQEFMAIRIPRGRADLARPYAAGCDLDNFAPLDGVSDYGRSVYNINEAEFTTVRDFYISAGGGSIS